MRYHEYTILHQPDQSKPLTLHVINRLKKLRRLQRCEMEDKKRLVTLMYGDQSTQLDQQALDLDRERMAFELEKARAEIDLEIEKAEIDQTRKNHVHDRARKALTDMRTRHSTF